MCVHDLAGRSEVWRKIQQPASSWRNEQYNSSHLSQLIFRRKKTPWSSCSTMMILKMYVIPCPSKNSRDLYYILGMFESRLPHFKRLVQAHHFPRATHWFLPLSTHPITPQKAPRSASNLTKKSQIIHESIKTCEHLLTHLPTNIKTVYLLMLWILTLLPTFGKIAKFVHSFILAYSSKNISPYSKNKGRRKPQGFEAGRYWYPTWIHTNCIRWSR